MVNPPADAPVRAELLSADVVGQFTSTSSRRTPALSVILACIGVSLPLFFVLVAPLPIWDGQPTPRPTLDATTPGLGWPAALATVGFIALLCLPFYPYSLALRTLARARPSTPLLIALSVIVGAIGALTYPRFGSDIFDYAAYERLWVSYGENPLLGIVANHPDDWIVQFVNVPDRTPAYGPLWALLTWPIARLAGDSATGDVVGYKLLSVAAYVTCCVLIWACVDPSRRQRAVLLFAWSPVVLFEALGKVHNDSLIAASLLAVVWLAGRGHTARGMLALTAGALVKATALVAGPALAIRTWRTDGWRGLTILGLTGLAVGVIGYLPFWAGLQTVAPIWQQTSGLGWSLTTVLTVAVSRQADEPARLLVRSLLALSWAAVSVLILVRRRVDTPPELAATTAWLLIAALLLLTGAVYGHYFVPLVALAAVAGEALLERTALWLSVGGLAVYGVGALSWAFTPIWIGTLEYQVVGSLVLFGPASIAMLLSLVGGQRGLGRARDGAPPSPGTA